MEKPTHHIFVCGSFRVSGTPQGICEKKGSLDLLGYIENELIDRSMSDVLVSSTGCLKVCDRGPALVIYPQNTWYGNVDSEDVIDEILDALDDGEVVEKYLIT